MHSLKTPLLNLTSLPLSGTREVQHWERHCCVHQEGIRQKVQPHLARDRWPQLRQLRHTRDQALYLLLPRPGRHLFVQVGMNASSISDKHFHFHLNTGVQQWICRVRLLLFMSEWTIFSSFSYFYTSIVFYQDEQTCFLLLMAQLIVKIEMRPTFLAIQILYLYDQCVYISWHWKLLSLKNIFEIPLVYFFIMLLWIKGWRITSLLVSLRLEHMYFESEMSFCFTNIHQWFGQTQNINYAR